MSVTVNQVLAAPLVLGVRLYQRFVSPLSPSSCRFYPSCSAYAVTALTRFGPFRGGWLAIRRLGRCHPWNPGGVDPVPKTWAERNDWKPEHFRPREVDTDQHAEPDERDEHPEQHQHHEHAEHAEHREHTT